MKFNLLITGVGGEGILLTSAILARAANLEGHELRGTQLHGLAQRGGSIPVHMRFGSGLHSPLICRGEADLLLGLEPVETARYCYFASRERTDIVIDNYPIVPFRSRVMKETYPTIDQIKAMIKPFAKSVAVIDASTICLQKLGNSVFGNIMTLGFAVSRGLLPLKEKSITDAMKATIPKYFDHDMKAFRMGMEYNK